MPVERYFYPEIFVEEQTISLDGQEHHHLINVMRTKLGEEIEIVNGKGQLAKASLQSKEKKQANLYIKSLHTESKNKQRIILAQGMPRLNRLEFIIEKGTELGMTEIWLFPALRSEKKELSCNQLERLTYMSIAAMKQCGRLFLPKIILMPPLKQWKALDMDAIFYGDTDPLAPSFISIWQKLTTRKAVLFCIGPESGLTDEEETSLRALKAYGVKLHHNILRTDTAAITALVMLTIPESS
jgi:16S rRNA (uracil1498-N3)-methyltransferase